MLLINESATVTICHSKTRDLPGVCRQADILVAAIGPNDFPKLRLRHGGPELQHGAETVRPYIPLVDATLLFSFDAAVQEAGLEVRFSLRCAVRSSRGRLGDSRRRD